MSDHSTAVVKIHFNRAEKRKGIFRAGVNIHNNLDYQRLIKNTIKMSIFCTLKHTKITKLQQALVKARVEMEERLEALLMSKKPSIEELIELPREVNDASLLEFILLNMKEVTFRFSKGEE